MMEFRTIILRKLTYFLVAIITIAMLSWLLTSFLGLNTALIQTTNGLVALIFGTSLILKISAKNSRKHFNAMLQMLSTFFIKMMGIVVLIAVIYFWQGKEVLTAVRFFLLGFFLIYSIAESIILNIK